MQAVDCGSCSQHFLDEDLETLVEDVSLDALGLLEACWIVLCIHLHVFFSSTIHVLRSS